MYCFHKIYKSDQWHQNMLLHLWVHHMHLVIQRSVAVPPFVVSSEFSILRLPWGQTSNDVIAEATSKSTISEGNKGLSRNQLHCVLQSWRCKYATCVLRSVISNMGSIRAYTAEIEWNRISSHARKYPSVCSILSSVPLKTRRIRKIFKFSNVFTIFENFEKSPYIHSKIMWCFIYRNKQNNVAYCVLSAPMSNKQSVAAFLHLTMDVYSKWTLLIVRNSIRFPTQIMW